MSLSSKLVVELQGIAGQTGQSIAVSEGARVVRCAATQCDALAVTIEELVLETPELVSATVAQLRAASVDLASRVNYLLEPIAPVEIDATGCSVQMRSNTPQRDDNGFRYYELLLRRGGSIELARYEKQPGQPRVRVPAVLTHEVVSRLIDDFSTTIDSL
jgi:hypothetical protein